MKNIYLKCLSIITVSSLCTLFSGCSSPPAISYTNPNAVDTTTIDFGSTDLQSITTKMVDDMLKSPNIADLSAPHTRKGVFTDTTVRKKPVLFISSVQNRTSDHIDTTAITNAISTRLINSGEFKFIDMSQVNAVKKQLKYQQDSDMVNPDTAAKLGQQIGARYMMYGSISSIDQRNSDQQSLYFQFTLKLLDIQTNEIVWQGEKQIRKVAKRRTFGW